MYLQSLLTRLTEVQYIHMGLSSNLAESFMNVRRIIDGNKSTDRGKSKSWSTRCYGELNLTHLSFDYIN